MMTLSPEQRRAIGQAGDRPVPIVNPETHQTYLIKADVYDHLRSLREEEEEHLLAAARPMTIIEE